MVHCLSLASPELDLTMQTAVGDDSQKEIRCSDGKLQWRLNVQMRSVSLTGKANPIRAQNNPNSYEPTISPSHTKTTQKAENYEARPRAEIEEKIIINLEPKHV